MEDKKKLAYFISPQAKKLPNRYRTKNLVLLNYCHEKYKLNKENCHIIDDLKFDANRYRFLDNIASNVAERFYKENYEKKISSRLIKIIGNEYFERLIKKELLIKVSKILTDIFLANIAIKKFKFEKVIIYNENLDLEFYRIIKKYFKIKRNIQFLNSQIVLVNIKKKILKTINFFKIFFHLETLLFKTIGKKKIIKNNYKYSIRIDEGLNFDDYPYSPDLLADLNKMNLNNILFYSEKKLTKKLLKKVKLKRNYNIVVYFDDLLNRISFFSFFKKIYIKNFKAKLEFLKIIINFNIFSSIIYKSYKDFIFWEIFYKIFTVEKNITMTVDHGVTSSFMHKKYGVKTYFIYPHFTEQLSNFFYQNNPTSSDWSYLKFDEIICDKTSKKYLDTLINYKKFNEIGFLFGNYIKAANTENLKKKLDILNSNKTIFFYDASIGPKGSMSLNESKFFYDSIEYILQFTDYNIGLRLKSIKVINENYILKKKIDNLKKYNKFIFLNDTDIEKYSLLSIPDLIISCPISTIIYEAISLNKKLLIFNPLKRYKNLPNLIFNNKEIVNSAENFQDLLNSLNKLINSNYQHNNYQKFFLKSEDSLKELEIIFDQ